MTSTELQGGDYVKLQLEELRQLKSIIEITPSGINLR